MSPLPINSSPFRRQLTPDAPVFNLLHPNSRAQPNRKPTASSKGAATQVIRESVEQPGLWWRTTLRQYHRIGRGCFAIQMGQDSLDHRRIFNAGNNLNLPRTTLAGLDIDIEHPLESSPQGAYFWCIQVIDSWRSAGALSNQFSPVA